MILQQGICAFVTSPNPHPQRQVLSQLHTQLLAPSLPPSLYRVCIREAGELGSHLCAMMEDFSRDRWYLGAVVEGISRHRWCLGACTLMRRAQSQTPLVSSFLGQREARNFNLRSYFITGFRVPFIQSWGQTFPSQKAFPPRYLNSNNESSIPHLSFSTYLETLNKGREQRGSHAVLSNTTDRKR